MKKAVKHSKKPIRKSNKRMTWQERLFDQGIMRMKPVSLAYLEQVGHRFINFCIEQRDKEDLRRKDFDPLPFYLEDFLFEEGIPYTTFVDWRKRSPELNDCILFGFNNLLGVHQERGAAIRKFSEKTIHMGLHHYLDRWKKSEAYHKELRKDDDPPPTNVIVKMKDYSDAE